MKNETNPSSADPMTIDNQRIASPEIAAQIDEAAKAGRIVMPSSEPVAWLMPEYDGEPCLSFGKYHPDSIPLYTKSVADHVLNANSLTQADLEQVLSAEDIRQVLDLLFEAQTHSRSGGTADQKIEAAIKLVEGWKK